MSVFKFCRAVLRVVMVGWVLDELAAEDSLEGDSGACSSGVYCLVYSNCILIVFENNGIFLSPDRCDPGAYETRNSVVTPNQPKRVPLKYVLSCK